MGPVMNSSTCLDTSSKSVKCETQLQDIVDGSAANTFKREGGVLRSPTVVAGVNDDDDASANTLTSPASSSSSFSSSSSKSSSSLTGLHGGSGSWLELDGIDLACKDSSSSKDSKNSKDGMNGKQQQRQEVAFVLPFATTIAAKALCLKRGYAGFCLAGRKAKFYRKQKVQKWC
jgi:hypothetical protein